MNCTRCALDVEARELCRWAGKKAVEYLCADCCPYCSDKRHSVAASRHIAVFGTEAEEQG